MADENEPEGFDLRQQLRIWRVMLAYITDEANQRGCREIAVLLGAAEIAIEEMLKGLV